ncbi:MAG: hypothetical protein IJY09_11770 [Lachnospiraceae bacterium]|nr:hypothetical protein [Lachnospiraceae bacterium]
MNVEMLAGIITGIVLGIILLLVVALFMTKKGTGIRPQYDERQQQVRGIGYKYAFFTMMFYSFFYGFLELVLERRLADGMAAGFIGIAIGAGVYATYCIWKEGYISLNENYKRVCIVIAIVCIWNFGLGIGSIEDGKLIENGVLTFRSINLICGILSIWILLQLFVKHCLDAHKWKEEEAEDE